MTHPFRFGVQLAQPTAGSSWQDTARRLEDLGYSSLLMPDHFGDQLAPVAALATAAEATTTLRVGALVFDNDFRHPVVLAKEMATIDVLSGGRVELGLGAGWQRSDYEQSGMDYDAPGVRVSRFEEAITVIKGLLGEGRVRFEGEHYRVVGMDGAPKPVQAGGIPLMIGGGGKRVLSIAGREADIVSINPNMKAGEIGLEAATDSVAERIEEKIGWVRAAAGDRFDDIEMSMTLFFTQVTDDAAVARDNLAGMFGITSDAMADVPIAVIGSTAEIADQLRARRDRWGFSYIICNVFGYEAMAPVVAELAGT